jgi:hypothetical protein
MLKKIIRIYFNNYNKNTSTLCGQKVESLYVTVREAYTFNRILQ